MNWKYSRSLVLLAITNQVFCHKNFQENDFHFFWIIGGFVFFLISLLLFVLQQKYSKVVLQFQSFQVTSQNQQSLPVVAQQNPIKFGIDFKDANLQSSADTSPAQKKKRKRKAHRLSDRRRNQQNSFEGQQIDQESTI